MTALAPPTDTPGAQTGPDPLLHPHATRAADAAAVENLLRCWVRETGLARPADDTLRLDLLATGVHLAAPVRYWSPVGWHRFGPARLGNGAAADAATVAVLLAREAGAHREGSPAAVADLVARVLDSSRRVGTFIAARRVAPAEPGFGTPFLTAEQSLLLGHPLHPTPKSREGLTDAEAAAFSPELRGSFALHWFAADRAVVRADSALTRSAQDLVAELAGGCLRLPEGTVPVPAHPWQARDLVHRPGIRALLDGELLHDLGTAGPAWYPTSSVRTVYRPGAAVMLKLSLGVRITNSRRENLRKELRRGVEVHRMLAGGLADAMHRAHPGFAIVRDPAWLAVDPPGQPGGGPAESGLEVVLRENPFGPGDDVACVAGLVAERPDLPGQAGRSRLAVLVHALATRTGRTLGEVAAEWFDRYLNAVAVPILSLYADHGIALEAHQQNTLVLLDPDGWPAGGRYRDNQGYYFAESRAADLACWLPGAGEQGETICADEICDSRLGYYVGVNNLMGLIGAFGSQGLADEADLLRALRRRLQAFARDQAAASAGVPAVVPALLDAPLLGCKANLLTRVDGLDELVGPLQTQSVYVQVANPLRAPGVTDPAAPAGDPR